MSPPRKYHNGEIRLAWRQDCREGTQKKYLYRYIYDIKRSRFIEEHRLVMEKHLGRHLKIGDIVHHINKNTLDNKIKNLRVFEKQVDHLRAHGRVPLNEETFPDIADVEYYNNIFGVNKSLFLDGLGGDTTRYGIKVINLQKREIRAQKTIDPIPEIGHTENCLTYSLFYLKQYLNEFFQKMFVLQPPARKGLILAGNR